MVMGSVFFDIRTECLNVITTSFGFKYLKCQKSLYARLGRRNRTKQCNIFISLIHVVGSYRSIFFNFVDIVFNPGLADHILCVISHCKVNFVYMN
jgi:hypothetical protein